MHGIMDEIESLAPTYEREERPAVRAVRLAPVRDRVKEIKRLWRARLEAARAEKRAAKKATQRVTRPDAATHCKCGLPWTRVMQRANGHARRYCGPCAVEYQRRHKAKFGGPSARTLRRQAGVCHLGHPLDRVKADGSTRYCSTCQREANRRSAERKRAGEAQR